MPKIMDINIVNPIIKSSIFLLPNLFSRYFSNFDGSTSSSVSKNCAEYVKVLIPTIIESMNVATPLNKGNLNKAYLSVKAFTAFFSNTISLSGFLTATA